MDSRLGIHGHAHPLPKGGQFAWGSPPHFPFAAPSLSCCPFPHLFSHSFLVCPNPIFCIRFIGCTYKLYFPLKKHTKKHKVNAPKSKDYIFPEFFLLSYKVKFRQYRLNEHSNAEVAHN